MDVALRKALEMPMRKISENAGEDGAVEFLVGQVKPGGALVVEVGEGALF